MNKGCNDDKLQGGHTRGCDDRCSVRPGWMTGVVQQRRISRRKHIHSAPVGGGTKWENYGFYVGFGFSQRCQILRVEGPNACKFILNLLPIYGKFTNVYDMVLRVSEHLRMF